MSSLASKVNVKPVNRRALRRYASSGRARQMVAAAVAEAEKVAAKADPGKRRGGQAHWSTPDPRGVEGDGKESPVAGNDVEIGETVVGQTGLPGMEAPGR